MMFTIENHNRVSPSFQTLIEKFGQETLVVEKYVAGRHARATRNQYRTLHEERHECNVWEPTICLPHGTQGGAWPRQFVSGQMSHCKQGPLATATSTNSITGSLDNRLVRHSVYQYWRLRQSSKSIELDSNAFKRH
jgi:hypothetical protein